MLWCNSEEDVNVVLNDARFEYCAAGLPPDMIDEIINDQSNLARIQFGQPRLLGPRPLQFIQKYLITALEAESYKRFIVDPNGAQAWERVRGEQAESVFWAAPDGLAWRSQWVILTECAAAAWEDVGTDWRSKINVLTEKAQKVASLLSKSAEILEEIESATQYQLEYSSRDVLSIVADTLHNQGIRLYDGLDTCMQPPYETPTRTPVKEALDGLEIAIGLGFPVLLSEFMKTAARKLGDEMFTPYPLGAKMNVTRRTRARIKDFMRAFIVRLHRALFPIDGLLEPVIVPIAAVLLGHDALDSDLASIAHKAYADVVSGRLTPKKYPESSE